MKVALITGITGQDGSYLSELLLKKNYKVWGIIRRSSSINTKRIDHLYENKNLILRHGDLTDGANLLQIFYEIKKTYNNELKIIEVYNLGAMSHVKVSFEMPEYTGEVDGLGTLKLLEAIRGSGLQDITRFYQASTSELFGKVVEIPQKETTPFYPRSPYGVAKLYSYWIVKNYRESYNMFCVNGILFNHEGPRRGETFVTRKITLGLNKIVLGIENCLYLGNLYSLRDWGHAKDYAEMQWKILQPKKPDDYVVATEKQYSVKYFVEECLRYLGIKVLWKGRGLNERAIVKYFDKKKYAKLKNGQTIIRVNKRYIRPLDVKNLIGDAKKARVKLGWKSKTGIKTLIKEMMQEDFKTVYKSL